jgi:hypothetical protein
MPNPKQRSYRAMTGRELKIAASIYPPDALVVVSPLTELGDDPFEPITGTIAELTSQFGDDENIAFRIKGQIFICPGFNCAKSHALFLWMGRSSDSIRNN